MSDGFPADMELSANPANINEAGAIVTCTANVGQVDEQIKTEIQNVIDFYREVTPQYNIIQAYTKDATLWPKDMPRTPVVAIQLSTSAPEGAAWDHIISYTNNDDGTATILMGHNYKAIMKLHCISYRSFDEADRIASDVTDAVHDYSPFVNRDRPVIMKKHHIIRLMDVPRKTPIPPGEEPEYWRVMVDMDLEIQLAKKVQVTPIDSIEKTTLTTNQDQPVVVDFLKRLKSKDGRNKRSRMPG